MQVFCVNCGEETERFVEVDLSPYCPACVKQYGWWCESCETYHDMRDFKPFVVGDAIVCNPKRLLLGGVE